LTWRWWEGKERPEMNSGSGRLARVCDIARLYPRFDGSWIAFYITLISSYCILLLNL
jgi:hypothetical protein